MARKSDIRAFCCILLILLLPAMLFNGVRMSRDTYPAGAGKQACLITLDVCEVGAAGVFQGVEPASNPHALLCFYYPLVSIVPPEPAKAVASADPGEIGKPPKA